MATQGQQHQGEMDDPFASLSPYEVVLLTTFRTSGVGVPTAMWFAHEHGKLYMVTGRSTGKLKRIRTTSRVLAHGMRNECALFSRTGTRRVLPCSHVGKRQQSRSSRPGL